MAKTQDQFNAMLADIDAATTEVASDLQKLRDELASAGALSDANAALLDARIARLKAIGQDPEQPVPVVEG